LFTASTSIDWSPRGRRLVLLGLAVVVVVATVDYAMKASREASAIVRWRGLVDVLVAGNNVYNEPGLGGSFPNPPLAGLVLWPFAALPPVAAALALFAVKVVLAAKALHWSIRLATADEYRLPTWSLVALLVLVSRPILSDLEHGNINIVILFLSVAGLWSFHRGRDWLAGLAIALATAIKLTPALFIPYFAYKRQWRVVAASLVGLVLFLVVVPGLFLGFGRNFALLRSWADAMVWPYLLDGRVETLQVNQSLPAIWLRFVTACPGVKLHDDSVHAVNFFSLDPAVAMWSLKVIVVGQLAWLAWLARTPVAARRDWRLACEYSLVFLAMLLISERSWKHHFVTMTLPYAVLVSHIARPACTAGMRRFLRTTLVAAFLMMASTSSELGGVVLGDGGHKFAQAYGLFGASAIVCLAALSAVLLAARPRPINAVCATEGADALAVA